MNTKVVSLKHLINNYFPEKHKSSKLTQTRFKNPEKISQHKTNWRNIKYHWSQG